MPNNQSRNTILDKIAAVNNRRLAFVNAAIEDKKIENIYKPILPDPITCFINELESISGKCMVCANETELFSKLQVYLSSNNIPTVFCRDNALSVALEKHQIPVENNEQHFSAMKAGITTCELLIARTGSIIINSATHSGRQMNVFPPVHIIVANASQLVNFPEDAYMFIQQKYKNNLPSTISTITGPSRTADIEKTLVLGAHGPKELIIFLSVG